MKTLDPKLILKHLEDGEKTFDELKEILGSPNDEWLYFHIRIWKRKNKLDIVIKKNKEVQAP